MDRSTMSIQTVDASTPKKHYKKNRDTYQNISDKLDAVNRKFRRADTSTRRAMLRSAHRFAVLSIQTNVKRHEEAFKELEGLPTDAENAVQSVNYWKQKMDWINELDGNTETLDAVAAELLEDNVDTAHKLLIDNVKGVGAAKAAFMIAILGYTSKMCLDTNIQQAAGIDDVYSGVVVDKYEKQCMEVMQRYDDLQAASNFDLSPFMVQWIVFDHQRGEISTHKPWFNAVMKK